MKLARPALSASLASFAALALLASANVPSAGAAALTWRGHQSAVWDSATANWDNAAGTAATFAAGDAVTFPGTVADEAKRTVTLPANVAPADVTVDSALDYTIGGGSAGAFRIVSTGALIKRGAGKLTLLNATDAYNAFPGGMRVEGGTLTIGAAHIVTNSAYEISLSPNAVIEFALGDGVGSWGGAKILFTTRLAPGAQWRVVTGANTNNLGVAHLTGAVVDYSGSNDNSSLSGDIFVHANTENLAALAPTQGDARFNIGTAAAPTVSVISGSRTLNMGYSGGAAPTIRFDVEEAARLDVSVRLSNGQNGSGAAGINKTGAGEMRLSATNNAFTGAITVGGGKLTVMNAGAVVSTHEAALTVGDGAVLEFANANHFGVNTSARTVTLNGGALRYTGDTWTAIQGGQGWPDSTNNLNQFLDGAGGGVTIEVVAARTVLGGNRIAGNLTKTGAGWFYFGIDGKAIGDITVKAGGVVTKGDYSNAYNKQNGVIDVWEGAYFLGRHDNVIALSVAPTVTFKNDGTLDLRGCALTVGTLTDGSQNRATGVVTNTANAADLVSASWGVNADATLTVNAGDYSGVFADGTRKLSLTKATAGELVLGGASTHSGETLITGGVLRLRGTGAALRNSPVTVRSAATLAAGGGAELPETAAEANATVAFGSEPGHAGDETVRLTAGKTVALAAGARLAPQPGARGTTTVLDAAAGALALAPTGVVVTLPADYAAAPETFGAVVFRGLDPAARAALLAATLDPATAPAGASLVAGAAEDEVLLAAFAAPIFTTSPTATVNTAAGATATLAATAAGGGLVFQWFREGADGEDDSALADGDADANGSVITGAATATLVITGVRHADAGSYYCVATDIYGRTVRSTAAALAVAFVPIEILAAPQSITGAAPNSAATFSVTATCAAGDGLRYAWHFRPANDPQADFAPLADGAGVTGSATATLRLDAVLPANAGDYKVVITNGAFSEPVERTATLAFALPAVVFAAQPAGASARLLGTVAFAALATGDTSGGNALVYRWQWRANSAAAWTDLADVAGGKVTGSATPELVIAALAPANAGEVRCSATDQWGTRAFSAAATLSLTLPALVSQSGDTVARARSSAAFSAAFADTVEGVTYQWFRVVDEGTTGGDGTGGAGNGAGGAGVVNIGGVLALALADGAKVTGSATSALTLRDVFPDDAGGYFCGAFFDGALVAASAPATLTVALDPLVITAQPADAACYERYAARFEVAAAGHDAALAYQWLKDGEPLANATARVLTIASARFADAGAYSVVVSDAYGRAVESRAALLDVLAAPPAFGVAGNLPATATADARGSLTLRVVPESGLGYQLQWQTRAPADATGGGDDGGGADGTGGDDGWVDLPGQTETALRLVSLTAADNGRQFRVVATNATGTVISFTTTLIGIPGDEDEEGENDTGDGTTGGSSSGTTGGTGDSADDSTDGTADGSAADGSGSPSTGTGDGTTGGDNSTGTDTDTGTPPTDSTDTAAAPSPLTVLFAALRGTDPTAAPAPIRILIQPADTSLSATHTTLATGTTTTGTATTGAATLRVLATGGGQIYYLWHRWIPATTTGTTGAAAAGTWEPIPAAVGPTLRVTTPGTYRCLLNNALRLPVTTAPATVLP